MCDCLVGEGQALSPLRDPRRALIDALYRSQAPGVAGLRLEYESSRTRTAAEAFEARAGNCLSLVMMTAAFARHLELTVSYQAVRVEENYTRAGTLTLAGGHVMRLGRTALAAGDAARAVELLQRELRRQPEQDEVHFALAEALLRQGEFSRAQHHLARAASFSTRQADQRRYESKLAHLRAALLPAALP